MIATPCFGGNIHASYCESLLSTVIRLSGEIDVVPHFLPNESLIPRARNGLLARFLADQSFTHILFIDADEGWPFQLVRSLVKSGHDMCAGAYPMKMVDWETCDGYCK